MTAGGSPFNEAPAPGDWRLRAKCRNSTADFFPDSRVSDGAAAKAICHSGCAVLADCLAYAMNHPDLAGIWGATTEAERRQRRRTRRWAAL